MTEERGEGGYFIISITLEVDVNKLKISQKSQSVYIEFYIVFISFLFWLCLATFILFNLIFDDIY